MIRQWVDRGVPQGAGRAWSMRKMQHDDANSPVETIKTQSLPAFADLFAALYLARELRVDLPTG